MLVMPVFASGKRLNDTSRTSHPASVFQPDRRVPEGQQCYAAHVSDKSRMDKPIFPSAISIRRTYQHPFCAAKGSAGKRRSGSWSPRRELLNEIPDTGAYGKLVATHTATFQRFARSVSITVVSCAYPRCLCEAVSVSGSTVVAVRW